MQVLNTEEKNGIDLLHALPTPRIPHTLQLATENQTKRILMTRDIVFLKIRLYRVVKTLRVLGSICI